jgi:hypothetical protein
LAFKALATYLGKAVNQKMRVAVVMNGDKKVYSESVAFSKNLADNYLFIGPLSGVVNYSIELYKPLPYLIKNQLSNEKKLSIQREFVDANGYQVDLQNLEQGSKIYSKLTLSNYINIDNLVINQRVPACMEIVNTRISQSKNRAFKDVNLNLEYKDIRDDRVLYFLSVNKKSTREKIPGSNQTKLVVKQNKTIIYTPLIATTLGECKLPAVITEAMYDSRISDYAKESQEIVVKTKEQIAKAPTRAMATSDEVKSLVRDFYLLEASNAAPREFLEYFHFPIKKHFNKEGMGQYDLLENKDRYNKEWKRKSYDIKDIQILQEDSSTQRFKVRIVFAYTLDNGRKKLRGVSKHLLTLQERNGKLAIESIEVAK